MKKLLIFCTATLGVFMVGCLKDHSNVDFDSSGFIAEISHASITGNNAPSAGLDYFNAATLPVFSSDDPDTVTFNVNIASQYPPTKDITVTVAIDDAKRVAYNSTVDSGGVIFDQQPDSTYSFATTTAVIKAGTRLATFSLIFYPAKINTTKTYMLPITLTDASGITISGNLSTIYFHIIGNLLAGAYNQEWIRYNSVNQDPATLAYDEDVSPGIFIPVSPTEIQVQSGTGTYYFLSFTNLNPLGGTDLSLLTNFKISTSSDDFKKNGISLNAGPVIDSVNAPAHYFKFNFGYLNGSGAPRNITDIYTR